MEIKENHIMYVMLIIVGVTLIFSMASFFNFQKDNLTEKHVGLKSAIEKPAVSQISKSMSSMSLTGFDSQLAKQFMDTNNDGMCDTCGMRIEDCIASGMMQCSMDNNAKIGVLGTQHIHADFKVYINNKAFDWAPYTDRHDRQMAGDKSILDTSAFIHIHPAQAPEQAGDVLHMHATGVPLHMFFESLGIKFPSNVSVYVDGKLNPEGLNYVFKGLDKILITDTTDKTAIQEQVNSITDFAKNH